MFSFKRQSIFKISPLLICLMCFLLGSCSDNSYTDLSDGTSLKSNQITKQAVIKYMAANYPILYSAHLKHPKMPRKALWITLNNDQKYKVWENHIHDVLANITLTKEQTTLLKKVMKKISPAIYTKNADRSDFLSGKTIKNLKNAFGKILARDIFVSLKTAPEINKDRNRLNY